MFQTTIERMTENVILVVMTLGLAISTSGYELREECFGLSRRKCQRTPACYYDAYDGSCLPSGQEELLYDPYEDDYAPYKEDSGEDDWEYDPDEYHDEQYQQDCYSLSKRHCKAAVGCTYDRYAKACFRLENDVDEGGDALQALEPPSADWAPAKPRGWDEMKHSGSTRSKGMHIACACMFPLPSWVSSEGGFFCWCI
ncbi:hypothetical protein HJC23_002068 [Cyclotella cryptica]|uniref:Secreted protein n=1 Tax=Cyclotella cryptica TaxID=29204 RepID=A0ABD3Q7Y0_9STRA|eukprot:CCRYP_008318-RA/>CCRYP_008318-RA protein AED:0.00 eAED:0.00 QI:109/1/1/1/1/1/2/109/197